MSSPFGEHTNHFAVILAGGSGTRLWPMSRHARPKHLLKLDGQSLLQETARRVLELIPASQVLTVTQDIHATATSKQLADADPLLCGGILKEPLGRNTLPAIAWAVLKISQSHPDALVSVFPSDHRIADVQAFKDCWKIALDTARKGFLVTFGLKPDAPETGYGYIKAGPAILDGAYAVDRFVEKPDNNKAKEYVSSGDYYWNSGMFVFPAAMFLEELKIHQPELETALRKLPPADHADAKSAYGALPSLSIDHGLMEKSRRVAVVPARIGWSDLGSWDSVYRTSAKDGNANVVRGQVLSEETRSSLLLSERGLLAAVGLENVAVIQTRDAVLVTALDKSQKIKDVVARIEKLKGEINASPAVHRPWGTYQVLEEGPAYKIKKIVVDPGQKLSLQRHRHRAEHWVVTAGMAKVTCGEKILEMKTNESTFIPQGEKHRLENTGTSPLVIIEVQTGDYVGEDDIERFEDIYGRTRS